MGPSTVIWQWEYIDFSGHPSNRGEPRDLDKLFTKSNKKPDPDHGAAQDQMGQETEAYDVRGKSCV